MSATRTLASLQKIKVEKQIPLSKDLTRLAGKTEGFTGSALGLGERVD
jgi:hypothetical protein